MSNLGQSLKLKYIRKTRRFCKILWKDTGHFRPNNRTFWTFQNPDSQTGGSGQNSNTIGITAIKSCKNQFQKCPKNYSRYNCETLWAWSKSKTTWGVFSIIRAGISFKPFFNACFRNSIVGQILQKWAYIIISLHFCKPNYTDFSLLFEDLTCVLVIIRYKS